MGFLPKSSRQTCPLPPHRVRFSKNVLNCLVCRILGALIKNETDVLVSLNQFLGVSVSSASKTHLWGSWGLHRRSTITLCFSSPLCLQLKVKHKHCSFPADTKCVFPEPGGVNTKQSAAQNGAVFGTTHSLSLKIDARALRDAAQRREGIHTQPSGPLCNSESLLGFVPLIRHGRPFYSLLVFF